MILNDMDLLSPFQMFARYGRAANERLYAQCALLDDAEYRKQRQGSFGSIHALLNHMLLADQVWTLRFEGNGQHTPPLDTILFEEFDSLREARAEQDERIESFFAQTTPEFLGGLLSYVNSRGMATTLPTMLAVGQIFNHQTHHRGQVHVMLSQTAVKPPVLDLVLLVRP
jgi:uncharacterized damage-inducible protein DinB